MNCRRVPLPDKVAQPKACHKLSIQNPVADFIFSLRNYWLIRCNLTAHSRGVNVNKNKECVKMTEKHGNLSIDSDNLFPIIKKWLYSDPISSIVSSSQTAAMPSPSSKSLT